MQRGGGVVAAAWVARRGLFPCDRAGAACKSAASIMAPVAARWPGADKCTNMRGIKVRSEQKKSPREKRRRCVDVRHQPPVDSRTMAQRPLFWIRSSVLRLATLSVSAL